MSEASAAERALFAERRGASSTAIAVSLQVLTVLGLLVAARLRGDVRTRAPTRTMVEFTAPPPRREPAPPPPPPVAPPPRPRARPVARPRPAPTPAPPPPTVNEAPPVMTAGQGSRGDRVATGHNTAFRGGETQRGAQGNAPTEAAPSPPAPPAPPRGPIQLPEDGAPPEPLAANEPPAYPSDAREQGVEAMVIATVVIAADGRVTRVVIRRGHPLFDDAVRRALLTWRYTPARVAGEAVEVYWNVRVPFRLQAS